MVAPPPDPTPSEPISLSPVPRRGTGAMPNPTPLTELVGREQEALAGRHQVDSRHGQLPDASPGSSHLGSHRRSAWKTARRWSSDRETSTRFLPVMTDG